MPAIIDVVHSFPTHRYKQSDLAAFFSSLWRDQGVDTRLLQRMHSLAKIESRSFAYPLETYSSFEKIDDKLNAAFDATAALGTECINTLVAKHPHGIENLSHLVMVNSTSVALPSVDAAIIKNSKLPSTVRRRPVMGLACTGGGAALALAHEILLSSPASALILLSTEICSIGLTSKVASEGAIIESSLFGDGAVALLMVGKDHHLSCEKKAETLFSASEIFPKYSHLIRGNITQDGYQGQISKEIPKILKAVIKPTVEKFLNSKNLTLKDLNTYVIHPGGPRLLSIVDNELDLPVNALKSSYAALKEAGNISSASVLFALEKTLQDPQTPEGLGLLVAMGPGFSIELSLFRI